MPPSRVCSKCGSRFKPERRGEHRCPACGPRPETDRSGEPWRAIYRDPRWLRARERVLERDGRRCRGAYGGVRCGRRSDLQVHHRKPLRELWSASHGEYGLFVELAIEEAWLVTLCARCHSRAERC